MPASWFLVPFGQNEEARARGVVRREPLFLLDPAIDAALSEEGASFAWAECLGDHVVAKIVASAPTLQAIATLSGVTRIPKAFLGETLDDLPVAQRRALGSKLEALGYSTNEVRDALGRNLDGVTVGDVLRFALRRRLRPRRVGDGYVLDGPEQPTTPVEAIDQGA